MLGAESAARAAGLAIKPRTVNAAAVWTSVFVFGNVMAAMLKHLRCPHCGYDIRELPVDPKDGATVCPECGCAWKLADSGAAQQGDGDDCE